VNGITHDEAKRLADMIRSPQARQEIRDPEWSAIADILKKHKRPAQPPLLDDRDRKANHIQRAQHLVAYNVIVAQEDYRKNHNCKRVPGTETAAMLDDFISAIGRAIGPQLSRRAILTIVKNKRYSIRYPRVVLRFPDEAYEKYLGIPQPADRDAS
jgi:hypothetical protein